MVYTAARRCINHASSPRWVTKKEHHNMNKLEIKKETDLLIEDLPEETTWDDLMYKIYVRQKVENGLKDSERGNVYSSDELRKKLDLI